MRRFGLVILCLLLAGCQQGRSLMVEANRAYLEGNLARAETLYREALEKPEVASSANLSLGRLKLEQEAPAEALEFLNRGLEARPQNSLGWYFRGLAHERLGQSEAAIRDLEKATNLDPGLGEAFLELAQLRADADQTSAALKAVEGALYSPSVREQASLLKAEWLKEAGDTRGARAALNQLLTWHPESAAAHQALGLLLYGEGDLEGAEASLRQALRSSPDLAPALITLGDILARGGELAEATRLYARVARGGGDPELARDAAGKLEQITRPQGSAVQHRSSRSQKVGAGPVKAERTVWLGEPEATGQVGLVRFEAPGGWDHGYFLAGFGFGLHILEGELRVETVEQTYELGPGQTLEVPRGLPVGMRSKEGCLFLMVTSQPFSEAKLTPLVALPPSATSGP